jgi:ankyrin repeat protein
MVRDKLVKMLINLAPVKALSLVSAISLLLCVSAIDGLSQRRTTPKHPSRSQARSKGADRDRQLLDAACSDRWEEVRELLAAGANPNTRDNTMHAVFTPLGCAVRAKNLKMIDAIIAAGAELNPKDNYPPLMFALETSDIGIIRELIARGADVNLRYGPQGATFLMLAASGILADVVSTLLEAGADVTARDREARTALDYAEEKDGLETERREIIILLKQAAAKK